MRGPRVALLVGLWVMAGTTAGCASDSEPEPTKESEQTQDSEPTKESEPIKPTVEVRTYELPGSEVFPEGVEVFGTTYYVGSATNGDVYRGELDEGSATVFVPGGPGHRQSGGIEATDTLLVVANGNEGGATVYDRATGALVARFSTGLGDRSNINDVTLAPNGDAYLTDFELATIYRIPAVELENPDTNVRTLPVFLDLTGTTFVGGSSSANGIVATPDGQFLLVLHYGYGELHRIRLSDKEVTRVDLHGEPLSSPDGMVLKDDVLYVVEYAASRVAAIGMSNSYLSGEVLSRTTDPAFVCPTTDDVVDDRLLVVNSQFCGPGEPPFTVVSIPLP